MRAELKGQYPETCAELKHRVNRLFFTAVIHFAVSELSSPDHPFRNYLPNLLYINEDGTLPASTRRDRLNFQRDTTVNAAVFPLSQSAMREGVYYYAALQAGALFIAVSDALVLPHFHTGSGLTLARIVLEAIIAILIELYPVQPPAKPWRGHLTLEQSSRLVADIHEVQSKTTRLSLSWGSEHIRPLDPEEQKEVDLERMCEHVNALAEASASKRRVWWRRGGTKMEKYDFRIQSVRPAPTHKSTGWGLIRTLFSACTRQADSPTTDDNPWAGKCVSPAENKRDFELVLHDGTAVRARLTDDARVEVVQVGKSARTRTPAARSRAPVVASSFETVLQAVVHVQNTQPGH